MIRTQMPIQAAVNKQSKARNIDDFINLCNSQQQVSNQPSSAETKQIGQTVHRTQMPIQASVNKTSNERNIDAFLNSCALVQQVNNEPSRHQQNDNDQSMQSIRQDKHFNGQAIPPTTRAMPLNNNAILSYGQSISPIQQETQPSNLTTHSNRQTMNQRPIQTMHRMSSQPMQRNSSQQSSEETIRNSASQSDDQIVKLRAAMEAEKVKIANVDKLIQLETQKRDIVERKLNELKSTLQHLTRAKENVSNAQQSSIQNYAPRQQTSLYDPRANSYNQISQQVGCKALHVQLTTRQPGCRPTTATSPVHITCS